MTLLYLVTFWVAGVFLASAAHTSAKSWLMLAGGAIVLACLLRRERRTRLIFICAALFAFGAGRYALADHSLPADHIAHDADSGYGTVTGLIVRDIDLRENHVNLTVEVDSLAVDGPALPAEGLILVQAPRYVDYSYGDRIKASGQLLTPPEFDDFSYRDYLARKGIRVMMPNAEVDVLKRDQGKPWYALLYGVRKRARQTIDHLLPSPQAPLLNGILLGDESDLPDDLREDFNRTGTSHVIAISGANLVVVMRVLMGLFIPMFGKRRAGWITMSGVAAYTLFVGAEAAVVRAAIMGGMAILAAQLGRRAYGLTTLAFCIWLMTLWNPQVLWDVGFQLSAAATAGLVLFGDSLTTGLRNLLKKGFAENTARQITGVLAEPVVIGLAAQITTTPLILVHFGRLSLIALLANILVVPIQPYVMLFGWFATLIGMLWTPLGEPFAWVAWLPLSFTIQVVRRLGSLDWASLHVELSAGQTWAYYGCLLVVAWISIQHPEDRAAIFKRLRQRFTTYTVLFIGTIVCILVWTAALSQPDGKLHVWFLDVGHGNAVLIQTPDGGQILVDGGPNPSRLREGVGDALPFWDRRLDVLILTQPKSSALNALPSLLNRYDVGLMLTNGQAGQTETYQALIDACADHGIQVKTVTAGYQLQTGDGVRLEILHPQTIPEADADPETEGMVIRVSYGDTSFLLTPELSDEGEKSLLAARWYAGSTVLEVPAHGSVKANPESFLQAVHPQASVITVGAGNRSGLPAPEVIDLLSSGPIYRTDRQGTIEMITDGKKLWIYAGR